MVLNGYHGSQWFSMVTVVLNGSQLMVTVVLNGSQWLPVVTSGSQWLPVVTSGSQWLPVVTSGSQWFSVVASGWLPVVLNGCVGWGSMHQHQLTHHC